MRCAVWGRRTRQRGCHVQDFWGSSCLDTHLAARSLLHSRAGHAEHSVGCCAFLVAHADRKKIENALVFEAVLDLSARDLSMRTEVYARQALQERDILASVGRRLAAGLARCEAVRRTLHRTGHTLAVGQQRFILRACGSRGTGGQGGQVWVW